MKRGTRLQPRPNLAARLLAALDAPPRLVAHLTLVQDTACSLSAALNTAWPSLEYDREAMLLGVATDDAGKITHPEDLTQPGHEHETAGVALLRGQGISEDLARFAQTHARWAEETDAQIEDLLVALADSCGAAGGTLS